MSYEVIIKTTLQDRPGDHELSAALILAEYLKVDVVFLRPESRRTPDIEANSVRWEIKSPRGDGKKTIDNNFRAARRQSQNIVIDLRQIKLHQQKALSRINAYLTAGPHGFKRVLVITKAGSIIEIL